MLTQHEIFAFAVCVLIAMLVLLRLQDVKGENLYVGTFYIVGLAVTGVLGVLELVLLLGGLR